MMRSSVAANKDEAGGEAEAALQQGLLRLQRRQEQAAIGWFQHAARLDPGRGDAHFMAGGYCLWHGRGVEAERHLRAALDWAMTAEHPPARPTSGIEPGAAREALFAAIDALEGVGLVPFLNGGTALGCVREGGFIRHDSDIDLGLMPGVAPELVIEALDAAPGLDFLYHDTYGDQVLRVRFGSATIGGDVFLYQRGLPGDKTALWCGVQRGPAAVRWRDTAFALEERAFLGRMVRVPDPVELYLAENYGDWRQPDPAHVPAFSAPNLVEREGPMVRAAAFRVLAQCLIERDHGRARALAGAILMRLPADADAARVLAALG